jgi:hypothetical protein
MPSLKDAQFGQPGAVFLEPLLFLAESRHPSLPQALVEVSARAGKPLWIPGDVAGKCCSTPWSSKGYLRGHKWMAATTCDALWDWSGHGTTCCGTAGDRGLLHPELVTSATRDEKTGLDTTPAQAYLSANRTGEMGLRPRAGTGADRAYPGGPGGGREG